MFKWVPFFGRIAKEQLVIPAHLDYLADVRAFVTRIGEKYGFSNKIINALKLAVDEAGTNIIKHAYRHHQGLITLKAIIRKNSLTMVLIDQGRYFDPEWVQDPDIRQYVETGKRGGLGIFIIRRLLDDISYRKTRRGNELKLTKYL